MKTKKLCLTAIAFIASAIVAIAQVPSYVPTSGLVGYWPFNGNANDISGTGNNGTVNGATLTTDRLANSNSAYNFSNGADKIVVLDNNSLSLTGSFTFNFWINISSFSGSFNSIISKMESGSCNHNGYFMGMSSWNGENKIQLQGDPICSNASAYLPNASGVLLANQWYNIGISYNQPSSKITYFKNGIAIDSITATLAVLNTTYDFIIGNHVAYPYTMNSTGSNFSGKIDDIGVWNRVLTQQEITNLHTANTCLQTIYDTVAVYDTTYVTITDTNYVTITDTNYVSVSDTLIINAVLTGINPPNNVNTIKVYPNPAHTHIYIDNGNFNLMNGYTVKITNSLSQTVYTSPINQQQFYVDLSGWSGNGIYFVHIIDGQGATVELRKIVLQ
jgi:hypothetical protein